MGSPCSSVRLLFPRASRTTKSMATHHLEGPPSLEDAVTACADLSARCPDGIDIVFRGPSASTSLSRAQTLTLLHVTMQVYPVHPCGPCVSYRTWSRTRLLRVSTKRWARCSSSRGTRKRWSVITAQRGSCHGMTHVFPSSARTCGHLRLPQSKTARDASHPAPFANAGTAGPLALRAPARVSCGSTRRRQTLHGRDQDQVSSASRRDMTKNRR